MANLEPAEVDLLLDASDYFRHEVLREGRPGGRESAASQPKVRCPLRGGGLSLILLRKELEGEVKQFRWRWLEGDKVLRQPGDLRKQGSRSFVPPRSVTVVTQDRPMLDRVGSTTALRFTEQLDLYRTGEGSEVARCGTGLEKDSSNVENQLPCRPFRVVGSVATADHW